MNDTNINEINEWLKNNYQCTGDKPHFRVVFSDEQFERRFGCFNEFCGPIFIREIRGVQTVPKYAYIKHRWVLERWMPPEVAYTPEIPDTLDGSYEPIQVFEHADGNPVPVTRNIIELIIYNLFNVPLQGDAASRHKTMEDVEFNKEVELNKLHLEEAGSALIKDGESII